MPAPPVPSFRRKPESILAPRRPTPAPSSSSFRRKPESILAPSVPRWRLPPHRHSGLRRNLPSPPGVPRQSLPHRHSGASRNLPSPQTTSAGASRTVIPAQAGIYPSSQYPPPAPTQFAKSPKIVTTAALTPPKRCATLYEVRKSTANPEEPPPGRQHGHPVSIPIANGPAGLMPPDSTEQSIGATGEANTLGASLGRGLENPLAGRSPNSAAQSTCVPPPAVGLTHRPGNRSSGKGNRIPRHRRRQLSNRTTHRQARQPSPDHRPAARPARNLPNALNPPANPSPVPTGKPAGRCLPSRPHGAPTLDRRARPG